MKSLKLNKPAASMPRWALLEREYLRLVTQAPRMLADYLTPEGRLFWPEGRQFQGFGGVDNIFEGFQSFPLLYMIGADDSLLEYARHEYRELTEQFSELPRPTSDEKVRALGRDRMLVDGVLPSCDWMHQAENNMFLYHLLLADPANELARRHVLMQSQYQFEESPVGFERNYDPENKVFAGSSLGANGPITTGFDNPFGYASWLEPYGLPYYDVPGVTTLLDLKDHDNAVRYGKAYGARRTHVDTPTNMLSTSLAVHAYMLTGDTKYRDFVLDYVGAWRRRAEGQEIMPDNAGPHGIVGETMGGRFYGGHYGWTHPHGYYFIQDALIIGGENERLLTGRRDCLDWARSLFTTLMDRYGMPAEGGGILFPHKRADDGSIIEYNGRPGDPMTEPATYAVDAGFVRYMQKDGWFEFRPADDASHFGHIYADSMDDADVDWMEKVLPPRMLNVDMKNVFFKSKAGQFAAFARYLAGRNPAYPVDAMEHSIRQFYTKAAELSGEKRGNTRGFGYRPSNEAEWHLLREVSEQMRAATGIHFDDSVIHAYYQQFLLDRCPLSAESLLNLTMGAMYPVYNGGMIHAQLRYFDADRRRPGLPEDMAALISSITEDGITLTLVNTSAVESRTVILQGGVYGEHDIVSITADDRTFDVNSKWAEISVGPGTVAEMTIALSRYANQPSLEEPIVRS